MTFPLHRHSPQFVSMGGEWRASESDLFCTAGQDHPDRSEVATAISPSIDEESLTLWCRGVPR
eukprot:scaffold10510_cov84-Skeletonema_dohrnii-CCMP3373.AAC.10